MFLEPLCRRNPAFVRAAIALHQEGAIPAGSYVLDLDTVEENARTITAEAARLGLEVFAMAKQTGRTPAFAAAVRRGGITAGVAVDMECARALDRASMPLAHIGHLVQVPRAEAPAAAALDPANWTVYDLRKAKEAAAASAGLGRIQPLLARVHAPGDTFYRGHEGGFAADDVLRVADEIDALRGVRLAGVTTFPGLLFDHERRTVGPTGNLATLERAATRLAAAGRPDVRVNAAGTTSTSALATLASAGVTQVEPGHGLTGTCPLHAFSDEPELPAVLYLSEVSHHHGGQAYCYGGGLYVDPVFAPYQVQALVANDPDLAAAARVPVELPPAGSIDYHGMLDPPIGTTLEHGASVVFGFRVQAFFSRALVAAVAGVHQGAPRVEGIFYPATGLPATWP